MSITPSPLPHGNHPLKAGQQPHQVSGETPAPGLAQGPSTLSLSVLPAGSLAFTLVGISAQNHTK